jgi:uncharacterized protein with beta-barrel porin domain
MVVSGATVTPKAGVPFLHLHESAFSETGANGLDLSSGPRSTDSLQPYVSLSVAQTFVRARDDVFLYANYDALVRTGNTSAQTVSAGLRVRF